MGKYQVYEKYKDSGVEWLGEIPEHWKISKAKFVTEIFIPQRNKPELNLDNGLPWLTMDDMLGDRVSQTKFKVAKEASIKAGSKRLNKGSVIASCIGTFGVCTINDVDVIINQQLQAFIPNSHIIPEYLRELVKISSDYFQMIATAATVVYVNQAGFANMPISLPPLDEQEAIAQFLDYKTKQIDDLIAKKETLIEKLDEKRTALISHAVTKGLDPSVPMKDSGIEWLGEIPEHWEFKRLKFVVSQIIDAEHKTADYDDDGDYLVVRTANVRAGKLLLENAKFTNESVYQEWTIRAVPEKDDILFTREAPAGEACLVPQKPIVCLGQRMVLFKFNKNQYDGYFLLQSLYSGIADEFIKSLSLGSTVAHFNMSDIGSIPLFIPSYNEQKKIGEYLAQKINDFDDQLKKVKTGIELLKEYRTALITNAVTGKIDVRQVPMP